MGTSYNAYLIYGVKLPENIKKILEDLQEEARANTNSKKKGKNPKYAFQFETEGPCEDITSLVMLEKTRIYSKLKFPTEIYGKFNKFSDMSIICSDYANSAEESTKYDANVAISPPQKKARKELKGCNDKEIEKEAYSTVIKEENFLHIEYSCVYDYCEYYLCFGTTFSSLLFFVDFLFRARKIKFSLFSFFFSMGKR